MGHGELVVFNTPAGRILNGSLRGEQATVRLVMSLQG
jgi:hypothetical protein